MDVCRCQIWSAQKGRSGNKSRISLHQPASQLLFCAFSLLPLPFTPLCHVQRHADECTANATQQVEGRSQGVKGSPPSPFRPVHNVKIIQVKMAVKSEAWRLCAHIKPHRSSNRSLAHSSLALQAGSQTRWHHHFCLYRL